MTFLEESLVASPPKVLRSLTERLLASVSSFSLGLVVDMFNLSSGMK